MSASCKYCKYFKPYTHIYFAILVYVVIALPISSCFVSNLFCVLLIPIPSHNSDFDDASADYLKNVLCDSPPCFLDVFHYVSRPSEEKCMIVSMRGNDCGCPMSLSGFADRILVSHLHMTPRCFDVSAVCSIYEWCVTYMTSNVTTGVSTSFICLPTLSRLFSLIVAPKLYSICERLTHLSICNLHLCYNYIVCTCTVVLCGLPPVSHIYTFICGGNSTTLSLTLLFCLLLSLWYQARIDNPINSKLPVIVILTMLAILLTTVHFYDHSCNCATELEGQLFTIT